MARRGFVMLCIDAIGRGNSGIPNDLDDPDFDETYGGRTSFEYLKALPYVDAERVGMMGHSLGAEMAYAVALEDPTVQGPGHLWFCLPGGRLTGKPQEYADDDRQVRRVPGAHDRCGRHRSRLDEQPADQGRVPCGGPTTGDDLWRFRQRDRAAGLCAQGYPHPGVPWQSAGCRSRGMDAKCTESTRGALG